MQLALVFTTSIDTEFKMESKISLNQKDTTFVWKEPFKVNGISNDCNFQFEYYIETEFGHRVFVSKISIPSGRLTYTKRIRNKNRIKRNSTREPLNSVVNDTYNITVDDTITNYTAERYRNEYIRLHVMSVCMTTTELSNLFNQTGTRVTLNTFKANHVITLENNKRYYTWFCKREPVIVTRDVEYDCDKNNSENNCTSHIKEIIVDDCIELVFTRDVFFPVGPTGLESKYIRVNLKRLDFDAMLNRMTALNIEQEKELCLDRAIRHNVLLQVNFTQMVIEEPDETRLLLSPRRRKSPRKKTVERVYTIKSVKLVIDDYKETIETEFK